MSSVLLHAGAAETRPVELPGPEIRASDLLPEWSESDAVLARSPIPGATRRVPRGELERWARDAGLDDSTLPEALILRRRVRTVSSEETGELLAAALAAITSQPRDRIEVEVLSVGRAVVPDGELRFEPGGPFRILNRPSRFALRWTEAGGRSGVITAEAILRVRGRWLEATRTLRSGKVPAADDFVSREGFLDDVSRQYAESVEELTGKRLNRPIRAAAALPRAALIAKPDVERGDVVELRVQVGGVRLRTAARAESSGSRGEEVALRNLETGGRVLARILDSGTAEVRAR